MRQMQRVLWTKGVLLSPQHLQTQDRYLEDLVAFQLSALVFQPWGFSRLDVDRQALTKGSLVVTSAAGIFPDGLTFALPESDSAPPPKPLQDYWHPDETSLDVYLAVPEHRPGGQNVAAAQADGHTRYSSEVVLRRDENTGLTEKPLQVARKNLRLLTSRESLEGHSILRVARVTRVGEEFQLEPHFIPPVIEITASSYLIAIARRLTEILVAKSTALSGMRRQRNQGLAEFGVSDIANFWLLYTVNTHLPRLRHLVESARGHPSELHAAMTALAGALTTFSTSVHPNSLPAYDHLDLSGCFTRLDEMVRTLLETVVPATWVTLPLQATSPSIHATAIDQDRYLAAPQLYLAIRAEMRQDELLQRAQDSMKVSSGDQLDWLIRQALPGLGFRHVPTPPSSVPIKLGYQYFLLDRAGDDWDAIRAARKLAVYVPVEIPDPQLELIVILPRER